MRAQRAPLVPEPLERGEAVAVVAPAFSPRSAGALADGIRVLERWGLRVRRGRTLRRRWGPFAGTDDERAADLQQAIDDPDVRAILFARGGWGTSRIIDRIDLAPLRRRPKVVVGYSDMTVLFGEIWRRCRMTCGYGPAVSELGRRGTFHAPSLRRALFEPEAPLSVRVPRRSALVKGVAEGPLVGGCLTLLAHLCGTGRLPSTRGAVLFFEEVGEEPYRVDRMLQQLRMAGVLDHVAAVLAGQMAGCMPRPGSRSFSIREVLADNLGSLRVPVLLDVPAGHGRAKRTLPLGFAARVDGTAGTIQMAPRFARARR